MFKTHIGVTDDSKSVVYLRPETAQGVFTNFKNVLIAQTIHNAKNIQQNTGINYYQYKKAKDKSGYYSNERLIDILYVIMNLEQGIKSGTIDQEFVIDYLICFLI